MAQVLVRNLEDDVVDRLRRKAKSAGTSLEEFARRVLREAAHPSDDEVIAAIDRIRATSVPSDFDSTAAVRADRDGNDDPYR